MRNVFVIVVAVLLTVLGSMVYALIYLNNALTEESIVTKEVTYNSLRERIIPLRVYRSLTKLREEVRAGTQPTAAELDSLEASRGRMNALIKGFVSGDSIVSVTGHTARLRPIETAKARDTVREVQEVWNPLDYMVKEIVAEQGKVNLAVLDKAIAYFDANAKRFDDASEILTSEEDKYNQQRIASLEWPRIVLGFLLAIAAGSSIPIMYYLNRERASATALSATVDQLQKTTQDLETSSAELSRSKQQSELILDTVAEGLILIDGKGLIGDKYSREVEGIFRINNLAGMNLLNLLQRLLTEKMYNTTRDYFDLLFNRALKERQVLKVNPLEELEVNFSKPEGGFITRYLGFSFRRIVRKGEIEQVLVTVNDVTQRVQLEQELRASEKRKERQFDLLLGILHVEPAQVREFIDTTNQELASLNSVLKAEDFAAASAGGAKSDHLRKCLDTVFRHVHNVKGRASYLQLSYFERVVGEFEEKIHLLRNRPALTGDDFLSLVICQSDLRNDLAELQDISQRLVGIRGQSLSLGNLRGGAELSIRDDADDSKSKGKGKSSTSNGNSNGNGKSGEKKDVIPAGDELITGLGKLVNTIASRQGKQVRLETADFDINAFSAEIHNLLKDVLIQLVRNAVTHGIEAPDERVKNGKEKFGTITLALCYNDDGGVAGIHFHDNGRGLDYEKILKRAVDLELVSEADAPKYGPDDLAGLIFQPGFSTAEDVTVDAGRGVGMDFVYTAIVEKCGGEIAVCSEPRQNCEYYFKMGADSLAGASRVAAEALNN
ncbi:MAG: ATP-binding protein [Candidatus Methylacidiphilales bacterium]